jgi:nucleoid DNA-binding protein
MSENISKKRKYKADYLRSYHESRSINKRKLSLIVNSKIKNISENHIKSVINLLIDEFSKQLIEKKELEIKNFLNFKLFRMPAKRAMNYYTGQMGMSKPYNKMQTTLNKKLAGFILKKIDPQKYIFKK